MPAEDTYAPPRLLPMWDSTLLAHAVPGRVMPQAYRPLVVRRNADMLPTLLVDGQVAGVWRAADGGLELTAFRELGKAAWVTTRSCPALVGAETLRARRMPPGTLPPWGL
ncbi:crosslink repair DNA glycosylase YcaQ family protein [Streptomyces sp. NPDC006446]|uniref:DNA glycosylase AlkZ-like family protein n=1 Tax=Streptomyces sp. NPDC006446 TaxID=3154301 RepID=UPI0033BE7B25